MHQDGALPRGGLSQPHLLGIDGLSLSDVQLVLQTAGVFADVNAQAKKKLPVLRGHTVALLFFEPSTRTRTSFEVAAKRLGADTISFSAATSSLSKGETLLDTGRNLETTAPSLVVARHKEAGAPAMLTRVMNGAVVNAGDGQHEHPTQALLDAYTLLEHFGRTPVQGLEGIRVAIVGDIAHSRVARSNMLALTMLGAEVRVAGPRTMLPAGLAQYGVTPFDDVDAAFEGVDAAMMLRIQSERIGEPLFGSPAEYHRAFGMTVDRFRKLKPEAVVMHPGPINRGVEIAPEVADDARSLILRQAKNGIPVRMAVLYLLAMGARGGQA